MSVVQARSQPSAPAVYNFSADAECERKILGFSGKLGSGKTTARNFLMMLAMQYSCAGHDDNPVLHPEATINEDGKIIVPANEDSSEWSIIDIDSRSPEVIEYMHAYVWPFMRQFSTAAPLKDFLINVFGIEERLLYGSQAEKLLYTNFRWEDMPGYEIKVKLKNKPEEKNEVVSRIGYMTGRDLMEYWGTEVVRKVRPDAWANALKNMIVQYGSLHSIVDDVRFPNECEYLKSVGGKIIRFTLKTEESDKNTRISNTALDEYDKFDAVIDNQNMSMEDTFRELIQVLTSWNWFKVVNQ